MRRTATAACLALLVGVVLAPKGAEAAVCAPPASIQAEGTNWRLDGAVTLTRGCSYAAEIAIDRSNVTLDCNGASLDGGGRLRVAILIQQPVDERARKAPPLHDITVRNCTIRGYASAGIAVRNIYTASTLKLTPDQRREQSPRQVRIADVRISGISGAGLNIARFVQGVVAENMVLSDNEGPAIYLSPSSAGNTIRNSTFANNGFRERMGKREGVAVDGSIRNTFTGNTFRGNAAGGLFLYKNCGEKNGFARTEGANENRIMGNVFADSPVGIWIAARQSRRLEGFLCSDGYHTVDGVYYPDRAFLHEAGKGRGGYRLIVGGREVRTIDRLSDVPMYAYDEAAGNTVADNVFRDVGIGVRVEDDGNRVIGNRFGRNVRQDIRVGSPARERTPGPARPVTAVEISGNNKE